MKFTDLGLTEPILRALSEKGYQIPTPIQVKAIPEILKHKDILGCAQTGTGKTAAFAIPTIQLLQEIKSQSNRNFLKALIVTPTRELAIQIEENIDAYGKHTDISQAVIFGGVGQGPQVDKLKKGVDILVATPGRLLDLISQGFVSLSEIKLFILDEADRMLDMGFINDVKKIITLLPAKRQSLFFSATMPDNIIALSRTILSDPTKIEVTPPSSTAETIAQHIYYTNRNSKPELLLHIINDQKIDQALVFTRTKHGADRVARGLQKAGVNAMAIHGDKAQNLRQKALNNFKDGKINILVATDIAARGIDIDKLQYVINYEIPNESESYVHRIGRSGRAGEQGTAFSICEPEELEYIDDIQKLIGKVIEPITDHPFPMTDKPMTEAEKKEWNKEKARKKQEFFANRKASNNNGQNRNSRPDSNASKKQESNNDHKKTEAKPVNQNKPSSNNPNANKTPNVNSNGGNSDQKQQGNSNRQNSDSPSNQKPKGHNNQSSRGNRSAKPNKSGKYGTDSLKEKYRWPLE